MNHEKGTGFASGRAFVKHHDSPKVSGRPSPLPRVSGTPQNDDSELSRKRRIPEGEDRIEYSELHIATPVKSILSSNITPRSGARKLRAESASPTPNSTPNGTPRLPRPRSSIEKGQTYGEDSRNGNSHALRSPTLAKQSRSGSIDSDGPASSFTFRPPLLEGNSSTDSAPRSDDTTKFFHANDVKIKKTARPSSISSAPKAWGMGYSNSKAVENGISGRSSAMSNNSLDEQRSKFLYADELLESMTPPPRNAYTSVSSRPILQTIYSEHTAAATSPTRPPSPLKEELLPRKSLVTTSSPRRHTRLVSGGGTDIMSPESFGCNGADLSRRSSINSPSNPKTPTRKRSSSTHSNGPLPPRKSDAASVDTSPVEGMMTSSAQDRNLSSPKSVELPTITASHATYHLRSQPQSPTKPQSKLDQMNELAANARRERKVLDLEISNSSLLAINQTLEREMRKHKADLRRYRRLSRTGRLSTPSSHSALGKMSDFSGTADKIGSEDDLSPSDTEGDSDQENEDRTSNRSTSASSRPSSLINRSIRTRFKDPKTTYLDLSAHRTLLLESQKLNQSIKRCLGHSESLLTSGKRALAHQEFSRDEESLGPRVLTPDEDEDNATDRRQGLLSPVILTSGNNINPWERSLGRMASLDSGLETPDFSNWGPSVDQPPEKQLGGGKTEQVNDGDHSKQVYLKSKPVDKNIEGVLDEEGKASVLATVENSAVSASSHVLGAALHPAPLSPMDKKGPDTLYRDPEDESYEAKALSEEDVDQMKPLSKPSDPMSDYANTPGNRSSLKNLGTYLQSFSIFANGGLRPP